MTAVGLYDENQILAPVTGVGGEAARRHFLRRNTAFTFQVATFEKSNVNARLVAVLAERSLLGSPINASLPHAPLLSPSGARSELQLRPLQ
jgi:hypothetical protein